MAEREELISGSEQTGIMSKGGTRLDLILGLLGTNELLSLGCSVNPRSPKTLLYPRLCLTWPPIFGPLRTAIVEYELDSASQKRGQQALG